ncbi:hypothetical protein GX48_04905 [Paracoccidioides brasiliensis]|nr:hypothetical protein GX48_04905 [Paracoccidioides brasiliensis]
MCAITPYSTPHNPGINYEILFESTLSHRTTSLEAANQTYHPRGQRLVNDSAAWLEFATAGAIAVASRACQWLVIWTTRNPHGRPSTGSNPPSLVLSNEAAIHAQFLK